MIAKSRLFLMVSLILSSSVFAQVPDEDDDVIKIGPDGEIYIKDESGTTEIDRYGGILIKENRNQRPARTNDTDADDSVNVGADGVTIINGRVWIDGKEIPPGTEVYKSPKTGKIFHIKRNGRSVSINSR